MAHQEPLPHCSIRTISSALLAHPDTSPDCSFSCLFLTRAPSLKFQLAAAPGRVAVHYVQDEQECIAFLRVDVSFEDAKEKLNEKLQPDYDKNEYLIYYATYPNAAGASIKSYINDADDYRYVRSFIVKPAT